MKYLFLASFLFLFQQPAKKYKVEFTPQEWQRKMIILNTVNYYLGRSLSVDQAQQLKDSLQSLSDAIILQLNPQIKEDSATRK